MLVAKLALDELLVWALDYETGEPLTGVAVSADGPGLPAEAQARTDGDGLARLGVPTQLDVGFNERYYVLRLDSGGRRGITSTRWQQGSEPWQLNLPVDFFPRELVGHVYSARPIYRPGETVFYKGVVRRDDDARYRIPEADPGVGLSIRDPQYNELTSSPVTLNDLGTFAGEFVIPDDAPTGVYSLQVGGGVLDSFFAGTTFTVAEFRVPEFRVEVATPRADYIDGDAIDVEAAASFFFGGPLAGAPVDWAVLSSATSIRVEAYGRYSFADFDAFRFDEFRRPLRAEGSAETDAAGVARFAVAAVLEGSEGVQEFQVSATVTDENAQAVASSTTLRVHPAAYYAGIKPESYIATAGEPPGVSLATVDVEGAIAPNRPVTVRIFQREWVTTKEQTAGGGRIYRSEPVDTALEVRTATTDEAGAARIEYVPPRAGSYRLVAESTDEQGRVARAAAFLWVSGSGRVLWRVRNDDVIELVADRDNYEVGDVAEVLVPTPFEGAIGLVTVERGRVLSSEVREFATTSERLRHPDRGRAHPERVRERGAVPSVEPRTIRCRATTSATSSCRSRPRRARSTCASSRSATARRPARPCATTSRSRTRRGGAPPRSCRSRSSTRRCYRSPRRSGRTGCARSGSSAGWG